MPARVPVDGWPCGSTHRFERTGKRILIWACEDQSDWHLYADTEQQLDELLHELGEAGTLPGEVADPTRRQQLLDTWASGASG